MQSSFNINVKILGRYEYVCHNAQGVELWRDYTNNLTTTQGKGYALDTYLGGGTGGTCYMGLISSTSYTAVAAGDTAAQINGTNGWKEANAGGNTPSYSGNRKIAAFSAASGGSKALTSALVFSFTGSGTCKGGFITIGSAATPGDLTGVLYSAGLFAGGDKILSSGDTLSISFTATMT